MCTIIHTDAFLERPGALMSGLRCAVVGCEEDAITIFRGYALCERCVRITDDIPDHVPAALIERIIADVLSGEYTLVNSLLKRGYVQPRDRPYEDIDKT